MKISNQALMVGVVPANEAGPIPVGIIPDDGTQVAVSGSANNGYTTLRTVTAGKTLYLSAISLYVRNGSAGSRVGSLGVYTGVPVLVYNLLYFDLFTNTQHGKSLNMIPPVEVPAGYLVRIYSGDAALYSIGFIHGYEM